MTPLFAVLIPSHDDNIFYLVFASPRLKR